MLGTILRSHYKIVKVLGIGQSGTTYLATDIDLVESPLYVVKKIEFIDNGGMLPTIAEKLFERQGSIAHNIGQHPQEPSLVARFEEGGNRYLIREYIEGERLDRELTPGSTWSQTQVFDFLMDLVEVLCLLHSFKYIHRDINPHNIIRRQDNSGFSLIGFSSVKDLGNTWPNLPSEDTRNLNDPSYVSYEQEQNMPQLNSDLYAVGAIAIQALTGKFPLEKDAYTYELKWRDRVNIDGKLVEIINRMVRPDYRNRYSSPLEALEALKAFALSQIPPSRSHQLKTPVIFGSAVCALLVGFGVVKLLSASANKTPVLTPPASIASSPIATQLDGITWKSYIDKAANIQIKYPANWQQKDIKNIVTGEQVMFVSPQDNNAGNKFRENISIRVENLTNPQTTLANYTQSTIAEIKRYYQDAKIVESSPILLAKRSANLVVFTGRDENSQLVKNLEVLTIDRGKAYILTYKARPDRYYQYLGTVMNALDSFELE
ncbi:serine/threonine protein kinase [Chamaesiphon minutus PCC 6605]|uniref:non-specific serine/threonine protein kinase n=2 Tax=Chamaesiphon TaxID=217161 RepID=K9UD03_CHAP6|nr:serine/threonine protein kinase [Chamaesiphon minutus PCC 6605]